MHTRMIRALVDADSAQVTALGIPYKAPLRLVTSDSICALGIAARYGRVKVPPGERAHVFEVGTTVYVVNVPHAGSLWEYVYFTRSFDREIIGSITE